MVSKATKIDVDVHGMAVDHSQCFHRQLHIALSLGSARGRSSRCSQKPWYLHRFYPTEDLPDSPTAAMIPPLSDISDGANLLLVTLPNYRFCEIWTSAIIRPQGFTEERGTSFRMARTK